MKKVIMIVVLSLSSASMHPMLEWFGFGKKSSSTEAENDSSNREGKDATEGSGAPAGAREASGRQSGSNDGDSTAEKQAEEVADKEEGSGRSSRGGIDFTEKSSITKSLTLDAESKQQIADLAEGKMGDVLKAFKGQFEDLQTSRTESKWYGRKSEKSTFVLDVLERVGKDGKLTGQDMVDLRNSLESFTDVVEALGDPESVMTTEERQAMAEALENTYGKDLGDAMRQLTTDVRSAFNQLPLVDAGVDPKEVREMSKALNTLARVSRDGEAFQKETLGTAASDFSDMSERMKNSMKEKYDSWVKILKRILTVVAVIAAVVVGIVFLHYILIAIKIIAIVGALGLLAYGCYKAPAVCILCWQGVKSMASALGRAAVDFITN